MRKLFVSILLISLTGCASYYHADYHEPYDGEGYYAEPAYEDSSFYGAAHYDYDSGYHDDYAYSGYYPYWSLDHFYSGGYYNPYSVQYSYYPGYAYYPGYPARHHYGSGFSLFYGFNDYFSYYPGYYNNHYAYRGGYPYYRGYRGYGYGYPYHGGGHHGGGRHNGGHQGGGHPPDHDPVSPQPIRGNMALRDERADERTREREIIQRGRPVVVAKDRSNDIRVVSYSGQKNTQIRYKPGDPRKVEKVVKHRQRVQPVGSKRTVSADSGNNRHVRIDNSVGRSAVRERSAPAPSRYKSKHSRPVAVKEPSVSTKRRTSKVPASVRVDRRTENRPVHRNPETKPAKYRPSQPSTGMSSRSAPRSKPTAAPPKPVAPVRAAPSSRAQPQSRSQPAPKVRRESNREQSGPAPRSRSERSERRPD